MTRLTLVVMARNETDCIERCLLSARHLVDRMVVLDTGSWDNTAELATTCGAEVHHTLWLDDFSTARNQLLDLADSDWNLVLDADEWIDSSVTPDQLRSFIESGPKVGLLKVRSAFELQGRIEFGETWIPRLLPGNIRYEGRVHEQPNYSLTDERVPALIHHDGYRREKALMKKGRNQALLEMELMARPFSAYLHYQMGVQHDMSEDWYAATQYYRSAVLYGAEGQPYEHDLAVRYLHALARSGQFNEALEWGARLEVRWARSSDLYFGLGNLFLDMAISQPDQAIEHWIPTAEACWLRCMEIGEHEESESHVVGRGSFLAAHNLSVIYDGIGKTELAEAYRESARQSRMEFALAA
jgi:glycosyltransferase involved in cell wall biosynthesis